jgi:hypothetical protein
MIQLASGQGGSVRKKLTALAAGLAVVGAIVAPTANRCQLGSEHHQDGGTEVHLLRRRSGRSSRLRRLAAGVAATLSAGLLVGVLGTSPALADSSTGLPHAAGHTCVGSTKGEDATYEGVLCAEIGIYTTSSGQQFVTLQAEAICQTWAGAPETCPSAQVDGTVANGGGYTDWTNKSCSGNCVYQGRNFLFPFGGIPISPGVCDANVWGSISSASTIELPNGAIVPPAQFGNLATAHFAVYEDSSGAIYFPGIC